jgi:hypothetical protein
MENDRGAGPATPRSPSPSASDRGEASGIQTPLRALSLAAANEIARRGTDMIPFIPLEPAEEYEAEELEIERVFKCRLRDLRRLPRHQRALALRAAREFRQMALQALREKRARERHARYMLWKMRLPPPRPTP